MTLTQRILAAVNETPGRSTSELASLLQHAPNRISSTVSTLARRGLVRSVRVRVKSGTQNRVWPVGESSFDDE